MRRVSARARLELRQSEEPVLTESVELFKPSRRMERGIGVSLSLSEWKIRLDLPFVNLPFFSSCRIRERGRSSRIGTRPWMPFQCLPSRPVLFLQRQLLQFTALFILAVDASRYALLSLSHFLCSSGSSSYVQLNICCVLLIGRRTLHWLLDRQLDRQDHCEARPCTPRRGACQTVSHLPPRF